MRRKDGSNVLEQSCAIHLMSLVFLPADATDIMCLALLSEHTFCQAFPFGVCIGFISGASRSLHVCAGLISPVKSADVD